MALIAALVWCLALLLLLPTLADLWSVLAPLVPPPPGLDAPSPRILALVPAHNEALLVGDCLHSLLAQDYPASHWRVLVVADNCTDDTAMRVRALGVECLERREPELPGKPRAIAWALQQVSLEDVDAVTIVDGDVVVSSGFASGLAASAPLNERGVQPYNDVRNPGESAITRMSAVFAAARFRGSFALKRRVGLTIPLSAGLCLGTGVLARYGWDAFSLCEDWELYASLTSRGVPIDLAAEAHLYAQETKSFKQSGRQRRRWMLGKLDVLARWGGRLFMSRRIGWHQKLDALGELTAPGPALHLGVVATVAGLGALVPFPGQAWALAALGASLARPAAYAMVGIVRDPKPVAALRAFVFLPWYVGWRLLSAVGALLTARRRGWERTERHAELDSTI
jgi:cellulose synthase/poly-beta-1,6-N-acetylglucosamine synthase-like glycosyltransferase